MCIKKIIFNVILFVSITCQNVRERESLTYGTGIEECKMSGRRLSCLCAEQEKPEPVEMMVLVLGILRCEKH